MLMKLRHMFSSRKPPSATVARDTYRPEIDGLRGIAVALVITFHAFPSILPGGWVGVDVFFVVSGYLITSLILKDLQNNQFAMGRFFERRVRRLAPAFLASIALSALLSWLALAPTRIEGFGQSAVAALTGWSNIYFWMTSRDYFADATFSNPLVHTWSLAVEEQFYLIFPIALLLLSKLNRVKLSVWISTALAGSLLLAFFGGMGSETLYYLLPTRAWGLLAGSLLAFVPAKLPLRQPEANPFWTLAGFSGLAAILLAGLFTPSSGYTPLFSIGPVAGTVLFLLASPRSMRLRFWLGIYPIQFLGLISYSAYLIHQPFLVFARGYFWEAPTFGVIAAIAASLVFAAVSYKYLETPFRNSNYMPWRMFRLYTASAFAATLTVAVLMSLSLVPLRPWGYPTTGVPGYEVGELEMQKQSWTLLRERDPQSNANDSDFEFEWFSAQDPRTALLLLGDSHSKDLYNTLAHSETAQTQFQIGRQAWGNSRIGAQSRIYNSQSYKVASIVVIASRLEGEDLANLREALIQIQRDGKKAVLVLDVPDVEMALPDGWIWIDRLVYKYRDLAPDRSLISKNVNEDFYDFLQDAGESETLRLAREIGHGSGSTVLQRSGYMCQSERKTCFGVSASLTKFMYDPDHHSIAGAKFFGHRIDETNWLAPLLQK